MIRPTLGVAILLFTACGPHVEAEHDTSGGTTESSTSDASVGMPTPTTLAPDADDGRPGEDDVAPDEDVGEIGEGSDCGCCEEYFHLVLPDPTLRFDLTLAPHPPHSDWPDAIVVACPAATVLVDGRPFANAQVTCGAGEITLRTHQSDWPPDAWAIAIGLADPFDADAKCATGDTCDCDGCSQQLCELVPSPDTGTTSEGTSPGPEGGTGTDSTG
jgi:hypothetical protein